MKKILITMLFIFLLCGCKKESKTECLLTNEKNEDMKSYIRVTLVSNKDTVEKEELYAVYKFKSKKEATNRYTAIEDIFGQEASIKVEQNNENIIAQGTKDLKDMQYDKKSKISYYEQLGYSCK